ncbi:MAG: menaquinone biosynthetic enzyme MqnA/MqnD family protein [Thermodesulfobacteriota bacterium]
MSRHAEEPAMARIGMVNFINTAPLYEVWRETVHRPEWRVTEAVPAVLNRMLSTDKLDLGFVSSHEYALHPEHYRILAGLSISASGPVGSVLLFSRVPVAELHDRLVLLTPQSQTSVSLIKIILEEFNGVQPRYRCGTLDGQNTLPEPDARLAIGDEALRLDIAGDYPYRLDLGEVWREHTGLPFVFAVWAVREEFCRSQPAAVCAIHRELSRCIQEGGERLAEISARVAPRIPMDPEACRRYLAGIEYDLPAQKQEALRRFFEYLIQRGEVPTTALPIRICDKSLPR